MSADAFDLGGQHPAEVLMRQITANTHLDREHPDGTLDPVPTARQVAAVLRSLSLHGQVTHLLSDEVAALGDDSPVLDPQAVGVGRYLAALAAHLRWRDLDGEANA